MAATLHITDWQPTYFEDFSEEMQLDATARPLQATQKASPEGTLKSIF